MKLSFSTLGCPDWSFDEVYSIATDLGYNGIELRGIADEIYAPKIKEFMPENIEKTKARLKKSALEIPILSSGAYLAPGADITAAKAEVADYVKLAAALNSPYVRVLGEKSPEPQPGTDVSRISEIYAGLCDFAAPYGVGLLIETNGYLSGSETAAEFMRGVNRPNAGLLWDLNHTVRFGGETPAETVKNIAEWIKHTHIKDSVMGTNGKITYLLTGYGDLPIADAVGELKRIGYTGFLSYEWVKRWSRELAEPGIAFYSYISAMRDIIG